MLSILAGAAIDRLARYRMSKRLTNIRRPDIAPLVNRILVGITLVLCLGCTMDKRFAQMQPGMTKPQVVALLGKPDGYKSEGADTEVLRFTGNHYVKLKNGRVTEYGEE
ncbi:MAG: hypothetical protein QOG48_2289 [Verrucomicrobiota bacterium]